MFAIRSSLTVLICAGALLAPLPVSAEDSGGLEIDSFPRVVSHGSPVQISGHVEGVGVETVDLQRRFPDSDWSVIATSVPDASNRVSFRFDAPRFSGRYRLKAGNTSSDFAVVKVRPKLSLDLSRRDVMEGGRVVVKGVLRPLVTGRFAELKWKVNGSWRLIDRFRVGDGRFRTRLGDLRPGRRPIRVIFRGDSHNHWARDGALLRVHDREPATWYGPGFFGNRTACGQRYHRDLVGVAHRTLPCGTIVSALYNGRSLRVPVVDRGPYGHANWDLTEETAQRLGFSGRDEIGVLRHRG